MQVQLQTALSEFRDYFVELNFTGWKAMQLLVRQATPGTGKRTYHMCHSGCSICP
jgi:hypothetical protein